MLNARLRRGGPWLGAAVATAIGAILGMAALVAVRIEVTSLRYGLSRLDEQHRTLREQVERLQIEAAALRRPERLRPRAQALGMIYPEPGQVISLPLPEVAAGETMPGARP